MKVLEIFAYRTVAVVHCTDQNWISKTVYCIRCVMVCKIGFTNWNAKIALLRASMVVTYYIKLFRTGADRQNGILISLLLLVAETITFIFSMNQKQPSRGVLKKGCSGNMQQIYSICNFIEMALQHGWYPANLLHIFRTSSPKNTCRRLLLN